MDTSFQEGQSADEAVYASGAARPLHSKREEMETMSRNALILSSLVLVSLSLLSCGDPHDPGIIRGSNRIENMRPRALIATTAMHALLETHPDMEDADLAKRAFEIADAMITEAEQPSAAAQE